MAPALIILGALAVLVGAVFTWGAWPAVMTAGLLVLAAGVDLTIRDGKAPSR